MDIDEQRFVEDYSQFKRVVQDLERRLASVIIQVGQAAQCRRARARPQVAQQLAAAGGGSGGAARWLPPIHAAPCVLPAGL